MPTTDRGAQRRLRRLACTALMACGLLAGLATSAQAATVTLNAAPAAAGTADCSTPANACTIDTAVTNANAANVADSVVIVLADGTYALTPGVPAALAVTFTGPSLSLLAASGASPTLDGAGATRILNTVAGSNVTVDGITFKNGLINGPGGAIQNAGTATVKNATFTANSGANGGAISNAAGGTLDVQDTTFSGNTATAVGGGAFISFGTTTVERSAILDNTAPVNGGGFNTQPGGTVTITSSTIAGNTSGGLGGAMSNLGTTTVQSSTIAKNTATSGSAIATGNTDATFAATIVAAQTGGDACNPAGTAVVDGGYNLDTDGTCISDTSPATGSHNGTTAYGSSTYGDILDAYLADAPANNGGPTKTIALLNSPSPATTLANPAFNVVPTSFDLPVAVGGVTAACSIADQRGALSAPGLDCGIGAYLLQATTTSLSVSAPSVEQNTPVTFTATVTNAPDGGTVSFDDGAGNPASTQCAAQPVTGGTATCTVSYPNTGSVSAVATYSGDGALNSFAGSVSTAQGVQITATPPPPPPPPTPPAPPATVTVTDVTATRCLGTGTGAKKSVTVGYTVSAPSDVTFTLQRRVKPPNGTRYNCPKVLPAAVPGTYVDVLAAARAATRSATATAAASAVLTKTVSVGAGAHTFPLKSLLGTTTLKPGRYRVILHVVSTAGAKAQSAAYFWVLKPKKKKK